MIIVFDGVCNLCNGLVDFVAERDRNHVFRFVPSQSEEGAKLLQEREIPDSPAQTIILIDDGKWFTRSDAAIRIVSELPGYAWTKMLLSVPRYAMDGVYWVISKLRYKLFGKRSACRMDIGVREERH